MEGFLVNGYMIASESFDDMNNGIKPSLIRRVKAWSVIALMCLMTAIVSIAIYWDDQEHYKMLGIPSSLIPFPRFIIIAIVLIFAPLTVGRIIVLIGEKEGILSGTFTERNRLDEVRGGPEKFSKGGVCMENFENS